MKEERKILFYKDYFISFYRSLDSGAQKKLDYVLGMLKIQERVSEKFVKFIREGLYEKVLTRPIISRIEKGVIEPEVGLFFRIIDALGLKVEIVKPIM